MSTRAFIGIQAGTKVKYIYNHFDGYLSGVGQQLLNKFDNEADVHKFLEDGDRSSIDESYLSRGEKYEDIKPKIINKSDLDKNFNSSWSEYFYLFKKDSWYYKGKGDRRFKKLTQSVIDKKKY